MTKFFAVAENYPDLKSSQNFLDLQDELSNIEDALQNAIAGFENNPNLKIVGHQIDEIVETEGKFSGIVEIELAAKTFADLADAVSRHGVSSVEILYPEKFTMDLEQAQSMLMHVADVVVGYENLLRHLKLENKGLREEIEKKADKKL